MQVCYPIVPLSGERIPRADADGAFSLKELVLLLNESQYQAEGLSALGFNLSPDRSSVTIRFKERAKAYADPTGDRTKTEEEFSERFFEKTISLPQKVEPPLPVYITLGGWNQDGINFLGMVETRGGYALPLTGRGTAALEGRTGDAHAGFCTGGACAAFQERVSILLGFARAAGVRSEDLRDLVESFRPINARYHGREAILDYTLHCALLPFESAGSYRTFFTYGGYQVHDVMRPLLTGTGAPERAYFDKLEQKFSGEELAEAEALAEATESDQPNIPMSFYPVQALPGNPILLPDGKSSKSLEEIAAMLNDPMDQLKGIQMLGFSVTPAQSSIVLEFVERGKAYSEPFSDRSVIHEEETELRFSKRLSLMEPLSQEFQRLPIKVCLGHWLQENVNFCGHVTFSMPDGESCDVPLTGRGTAALEGKSGDAHSGFCTGGACAAFQNRVALCLTVARCLGAHEDHLESLTDKFREMNGSYHGRDDILDYSLHCVLGRSPKTYMAFMKERYPTHIGRPPVLTAMLKVGRPPPTYFVKLAQKFSAEELDAERRRHVVQVPTIETPAAPKPVVAETFDMEDLEAKKKIEMEKKKKEKRSEKNLTTAAVVASACIGVVVIILFFALRR